MPQYDACCDGDVQRVLGPVLRNLQNAVRCVHDFLLDTVHLIAEDERVFLAFFRDEGVQADGIHGLLHAQDYISLLVQALHKFQCIRCILPFHTEFRTEGGFVDFGRRRGSADSAKPYLVGLERIAAAEYLAYVVGAPDVVQYDVYAGFRQCLVLFRGDASQLYIEKFPVFHDFVVIRKILYISDSLLSNVKK